METDDQGGEEPVLNTLVGGDLGMDGLRPILMELYNQILYALPVEELVQGSVHISNHPHKEFYRESLLCRYTEHGAEHPVFKRHKGEYDMIVDVDVDEEREGEEEGFDSCDPQFVFGEYDIELCYSPSIIISKRYEEKKIREWVRVMEDINQQCFFSLKLRIDPFHGRGFGVYGYVVEIRHTARVSPPLTLQFFTPRIFPFLIE